MKYLLIILLLCSCEVVTEPKIAHLTNAVVVLVGVVLFAVFVIYIVGISKKYNENPYKK